MPEGDAPEPAEDPARQLWAAAQQGDADAFRGLLETFQTRVMRVMTTGFHYDRGTAEDLCQEVFLRVHQGLPGFDGKVRFCVWLHAIANHVAISEYRRRKARKRAGGTVPLQPEDEAQRASREPVGREIAPPRGAEQREFLHRVRECVAALPEEFRLAVVLRDMESLSYEEIATILELPAGTVRSRIHRGRLLLAASLQGFAP
jgi:RNA polymerase sigma-70 factor, ECF subfamily